MRQRSSDEVYVRWRRAEVSAVLMQQYLRSTVVDEQAVEEWYRTMRKTARHITDMPPCLTCSIKQIYACMRSYHECASYESWSNRREEHERP